MKLLRLGTALSATVISFLPCFYTSANAQEPDYACFMITQAGKVIDLSKSICGFKKSAPTVSANKDQASSEDDRRNLLEDKALRQEALRLIQQRAEGNISKPSEPSTTYIPR